MVRRRNSPTSPFSSQDLEKNMLLIFQLSKKMILSASLIFLTTNAFIPIVYAQKAVILNFDDDWIGQYNYVLPILQKYGFNATFYITCGCLTYQNSKFCNNAGGDSAMSWQNVAELAKLGYDIQSHGMSHKDLTKLSIKDLEYEVGQSKQCLLEHNINSTVFGNPFARGWDNSTVIQTLSKYYDMARGGYGLLTFLDCYPIDLNQTDCRTYFDNGTLTLANRYSLRLASHNDLDSTYMHNSTKILRAFIEAVNKQTNTIQ